MPSTNKAEYDMQYAKQNLKRIPLNVQKEKYAEIQSAAQKAGESINGYIKKAIDERMERDSIPTTANWQHLSAIRCQSTAIVGKCPQAHTMQITVYNNQEREQSWQMGISNQMIRLINIEFPCVLLPDMLYYKYKKGKPEKRLTLR